jgi:hypothetical protein
MTSKCHVVVSLIINQPGGEFIAKVAKQTHPGRSPNLTTPPGRDAHRNHQRSPCFTIMENKQSFGGRDALASTGIIFQKGKLSELPGGGCFFFIFGENKTDPSIMCRSNEDGLTAYCGPDSARHVSAVMQPPYKRGCESAQTC